MFAPSYARMLAGLALPCSVAAACGQMHHVDKPQQVTRAVGVYEWTGELDKPTAARFVPVSLFIDGHFEDAGLYLARPVPFALEDGDLYTVEHAGEPEGVLDLQDAARVVSGNALADDDPEGVWYGFGKFTGQAAPKPEPVLHHSAHTPTIQVASGPNSTRETNSSASNDDGQPHMSRRQAGGSASGDSGQSSGSDTSSPSSSGSKPAQSPSASSGSDDDTDRPTLARRDPSQDAARRRSEVGGRRGTASVTSAGPAPGDDPDRPRLTHNTAAEEEVKQLTGMPADLHQAVAVSDPVLRDPHPFARAWDAPDERASTLAAMEELARPALATYLAENRLTPSNMPLSSPPPSQSAEGRAAATENGAGAPPRLERGKPVEYAHPGAAPVSAKPTLRTPAPATSKAKASAHGTHPGEQPAGSGPLLLQHEQLAGYTLSYGGLPTFVYTAAVSTNSSTATTAASAAARPTAYVTVVAQRLPTGKLQVALSAMTDSQHLDRSPRLQLIDAVDPDASHRGSLLFELRGAHSRQFALYRLITAKAENTFTTASLE